MVSLSNWLLQKYSVGSMPSSKNDEVKAIWGQHKSQQTGQLVQMCKKNMSSAQYSCLTGQLSTCIFFPESGYHRAKSRQDHEKIKEKGKGQI